MVQQRPVRLLRRAHVKAGIEEPLDRVDVSITGRDHHLFQRRIEHLALLRRGLAHSCDTSHRRRRRRRVARSQMRLPRHARFDIKGGQES